MARSAENSRGSGNPLRGPMLAWKDRARDQPLDGDARSGREPPRILTAMIAFRKN